MKINKYLFLVLLIPLSVLPSSAKDKDIPQPVMDAFNKQYPNAKEVKWEKESSLYEVEFDLDEIDYSVTYDASGNMKETEQEIGLNELPSSINDYIDTHYKNKKAQEVFKITSAEGVVTYEVEVRRKELLFNSTGEFLKEIQD